MQTLGVTGTGLASVTGTSVSGLTSVDGGELFTSGATLADVAVESGKLVAENGTMQTLGVTGTGLASVTGTSVSGLTSVDGGELFTSGATLADVAVESGKLVAENGTMQTLGVTGTGLASVTGTSVSSLTSVDGGELFTSGATLADVAVESGKLVAENGTMQTLDVIGGNATVTGSSVNSLAVSGGTVGLTNSTLNAAGLTVNGGATTLKNVTTPALSEVTANDGTLIIKDMDIDLASLTIDKGAVKIFDSLVDIEMMTSKGGTFFADPSTVIIKALAGNELGSATTIGADTTVVIGGDSIDNAVAGASAYTDGKAALVLGKHIKVSGGLLVDKTADSSTPVPSAGSATFGAGSLLAADGHDIDGTEEPAIITGTDSGALKVSSDSILYLSNVAMNKTYTVAEGFTSYDVQGWSQENGTLLLSGLFTGDIKAVTHDDGSVEIVTSVKINEESKFFDAIPSNALYELAEVGGLVDSENIGRQFLSRAVDPTYMPDEGQAISAVNEVSRAAVTAGVQNSALRIADAASNSVLDHMSFANHNASDSIHADGADFWATPMYGNLYTSDMVVASSSVRGQFGGLALGIDTEGGQFRGGKFRFGAAINGGGGQSSAKGNVTSVSNDYDFGGLNVYAGWNNGTLNVIGSLGYGIGSHEVSMGMPSGLKMDSAKADIDTSVFTADLRSEYQIKTNWLDVLPHAGIRYTALRTDAHDLKVGGSVLNSVESDTQHIVQFPIGVTLSKDFAHKDWNVKPMVDLSVIPAAGDKDAHTKMNFAGMDAWDSVNSRIMDSTSWAGTVGIQAEKGNLSIGLDYSVQASSRETDQNIKLKLNWKF